MSRSVHNSSWTERTMSVVSYTWIKSCSTYNKLTMQTSTFRAKKNSIRNGSPLRHRYSAVKTDLLLIQKVYCATSFPEIMRSSSRTEGGMELMTLPKMISKMHSPSKVEIPVILRFPCHYKFSFFLRQCHVGLCGRRYNG